jgi:hypothetical protein
MDKPVDEQLVFKERVLPGILSFVPLLIIYPTFWLTLAPFNALFGSITGAFVTILVVGLMVRNAPVISLTNERIRVGRANIELGFVGKAKVIEAQDRRAETGTKLDARAYLRLQPAVKGLVRLEIQDPNDPTPYWLFSSRKAEQLTESLGSITNRKN